MVVVTGIPGSGKSSLVKNRFPNYTRINLDTMKSRAKENAELLRALNCCESVVIDNTNTTERSRSRYIEIAKPFGIPIRSIFLNCPVEIALKRNSSRRGRQRVPPFVVKLYQRRLEPPQINEGFTSCEVIVPETDEMNEVKTS
jgi:predicted kinase